MFWRLISSISGLAMLTTVVAGATHLPRQASVDSSQSASVGASVQPSVGLQQTTAAAPADASVNTTEATGGSNAGIAAEGSAAPSVSLAPAFVSPASASARAGA